MTATGGELIRSTPAETCIRYGSKNENHILWKNGKPYATSPNLITVIDTDTGRPVLNSHLKDGLNVSIVVSPIHDKYLTEEALEVFSPRYFGFDFDYIPFDEVRNK